MDEAGAVDRGVPAQGQDPAPRPAAHALGHPLAAPDLWRHQNGAKWRAIPADLGPWWRAAQVFIRWARVGVWERLLALVQERGVELGMVFLDGTNMRAHQKAAGAARRGALKLSETVVRRSAALVVGMAPKLA